MKIDDLPPGCIAVPIDLLKGAKTPLIEAVEAYGVLVKDMMSREAVTCEDSYILGQAQMWLEIASGDVLEGNREPSDLEYIADGIKELISEAPSSNINFGPIFDTIDKVADPEVIKRSLEITKKEEYKLEKFRGQARILINDGGGDQGNN